MFFIKDDENKSVFSFIQGLTYPLIVINNNLKNFLSITCFFAFTMAVLSFFSGKSFLCGLLLSADMDVGVFCSSSNFLMIISLVVNFIVISFYLNRIGMIDMKQEKRFWFLQKIGLKQELKAFLVVCLYLLLWGVICGIGYVLKIREVTPDWKNELSIFVLLSSFIILAFFFLFNFVCFIHYLHGGRFFDIKKTFLPIFDEIFKVIFWFLIYFIIFIFLFSNAFQYFVAHINFYSVFACEFCLYFLLYFMIAVMYFSFEYQEKALFIKEE